MKPVYKQTQIWFLTIIMILLVGILTGFIFDAAIESAEGRTITIFKIVGLVATGFFVLVLAAFYSFTIQIADGRLSFWFGFGVARRSIRFEDIHSVEVVVNP